MQNCMFCSTTALQGNCSAASAARDATPIFFPEKENGRRPSKRKAFPIAGEQLEELQCLPIVLPCARRCRVWCCYTTWPTSTTRCRSAHLVFVQPNHLLSAIHIVLVMRTAASEAMPPWQAIASLCKSEVDGDCVRPPTRRQSDSEDRRKSNRLDTSSSRHLIAQRVQFFKLQPDNTKSFSWGSKGDILFCEREYPL